MSKNKYYFPLTLLCALAYFASYLTRLNYQALISAIVEAEGVDKSTASWAVTALFITYGLGQLLSGVLGDKLDPRLMIAGGLGLSAILNVFMPLMPSVGDMTALWALNGFFQAMIWPPVVKILSSNLTDKQYANAVFWVNTAAMIGNVLMYLFAPAMITIGGVGAWRTVFYVSAGVGLFFAVLFFIASHRMDISVNGAAKPVEAAPEEKPVERKIKLVDIIPFVLLSMMLQGLLRDGITTWTPSYLSETFHIDAANSILKTVLLPISSIICYKLAALVLKKLGGNEPKCCAALYGVFAVFGTLLFFFGDVNSYLSTAFLMICTGITHAINYVLICIAPNRFKGSKVSSIAGLFNFSVYVGSAVSTFGFAKLAETKGWDFTVGSWIAAALLGGLCCVIIIRKWKTRLMDKKG